MKENWQEVELIAPTGTPIVGRLMADGTICPLTATYSQRGETLSTKFGPSQSVAVLRQGEMVFVDAEGNEWGQADIEFNSRPPPQSRPSEAK